VSFVERWESAEHLAPSEPVHPGAILKDELAARDLTANRLALDLGVPSGRIAAILNGKRALTPDTALRLGRYFAMPARFWVDLQAQYDLAVAEQRYGKQIAAQVRKAAA
jgi:addiction module HigA family antidote